jgi:hypothetical protein
MEVKKIMDDGKEFLIKCPDGKGYLINALLDHQTMGNDVNTWAMLLRNAILKEVQAIQLMKKSIAFGKQKYKNELQAMAEDLDKFIYRPKPVKKRKTIFNVINLGLWQKKQ